MQRRRKPPIKVHSISHNIAEAGEAGRFILERKLALNDFKQMATQTLKRRGSRVELLDTAHTADDTLSAIFSKFSSHSDIIFEALFDDDKLVRATARLCVSQLRSDVVKQFALNFITDFNPLSENNRKNSVFVFETLVGKLARDIAGGVASLRPELLLQLRKIYKINHDSSDISDKQRKRVLDAKIIVTQNLLFLNDQKSVGAMCSQIDVLEKNLDALQLLPGIPEKEIVLLFVLAESLFRMNYTKHYAFETGFKKAVGTFRWMANTDNIPNADPKLYFYKNEDGHTVYVLEMVAELVHITKNFDADET